MDKETLLSKIKPGIGDLNASTQKYGDTNLSAKTLDAWADGILPTITDDSMVTDAFVNGQLSFLKSVGGQIRFENSEFAKNYKPSENDDHRDKGKKTEGGADDRYNELKKSLDDLQQKLDTQNKRTLDERMKLSVRAKSDSLMVHNKALWNDAVGMVDVSDGMDEEKLTEAVKRVYEEKLKLYFGDGANPYGGNGSGGGGNDDASAKMKRDAFKARMQSNGRLPNQQV